MHKDIKTFCCTVASPDELKDFNQATDQNHSKVGTRYLVFGFPGVGKSTYVKAKKKQPRLGTTGAIDFDVKGPDCWKGVNCPELVKASAAYLVNAWLECGADVMTHPWSVDPDRCYPAKILIVKPDTCFRNEWAERIRKRGDCDFAAKMFNEWWQWHDGIVEFAVRLYRAGNSVETIFLDPDQYLSDVMIGEFEG